MSRKNLPVMSRASLPVMGKMSLPVMGKMSLPTFAQAPSDERGGIKAPNLVRAGADYSILTVYSWLSSRKPTQIVAKPH